MTDHNLQFYIDGQWVASKGRSRTAVINPATEEVIAEVSLASAADVNDAVAAAKRAFPSFSQSTVQERIDLLEKMLAIYERRKDEFAQVLTSEMGAPIDLASGPQAGLGTAHLQQTIDALKNLTFEEERGNTLIVKEPIGVAALITPWNWPINQVFTKVASALAAGCTMVLKPSEVAPLDAMLFAEVVDEAGVPAGVFNVINGEGPVAGHALVSHPDIDVVSFTGSTRAGVQISQAAATTVKTVHLELGGKSPNVILDDANLEEAVTLGVGACFANAGQSCSVATRMLVPKDKLEEAAAIAKTVAEAYVVGDPSQQGTTMGPLVNSTQFAHVQRLIQAGIDEGADLVTGGPGKPEGLETGYFVKPTVFTNVDNSMDIAQTEIFGPVLSIIGYEDEDDAVRIANDTIYGLAAVVQSTDADHARDVARKLRAGHVYFNHEMSQYAASPFGGMKQSGNGYEHGEWGIEGFLVKKALLGAVST